MRNRILYISTIFCWAILFTIITPELSAKGESEDIVPSLTNWEHIIKRAKGSQVSFYMYGESKTINNWVDTVVARSLKEQYDITLQRVPMDINEVIDTLLVEKQTDVQKGKMDLIWINGENFHRAKSGGLLWGPYADTLPNYVKYVNPKATVTDFGYPTEGYEVPYGESHFVFVYNTATVPFAPADFDELTTWIKSHPGRFTYPKPPSFVGSAFLRIAFYYVNGGHEQFLGKWDEERAKAGIRNLFAWLEDITPYLWKEGQEYPDTLADIDQLFEQNVIDFSMSYNMSHASNKIANGEYPPTARTFVPASLALYNHHFTAIPFNAPNKVAALVLSNHLLSTEIQLSKADPVYWGDASVLDPQRLSLQEAESFKEIDLGIATLSREELTRHAVPEIGPEYVEYIESGWKQFIAKRE